MGYNVYITRAQSWSENMDHWIDAEEWLRIVEKDQELQRDPNNGMYFVIWKGPSEDSNSWFDWSKGNIFTKNPDSVSIGKMLEVARQLNAKVQGDDGETYGQA